MLKNCYLLFGLLTCLCGFAQGENNNWYFGKNAGVNFATNPPTAITTSAMVHLEGVASISDAAGNVLFYTNGINIWNKLNQVMPNGTGLLSHDSSAQGVVIVPVPGKNNLYYVFTAHCTAYINSTNGHPYNYSVVDMDLDGGNGDIVTGQKNLPLYDETGTNTPIRANDYSHEAMTFLKDATGSGYWLLVPVTYPVNKLYSFKIDNTGLVNNPVISTLAFGPHSVYPQNDTVGNIKASPDGSVIVISRHASNQELKIYSFSTATGMITGPIGNCSNCNAYSNEFSYNSKQLYFYSSTNGINVIDVATGALRQLFTNAFTQCALQRAVNSEIYVSKITQALPPTVGGYGTNSLLYWISNQTSWATSNILPADNVNLGTLRYARIGLPPFIDPIKPDICLYDRVFHNITQTASATYSAANTITASNNYVINSGVQVVMKAGSAVVLKPDVHIKSGSTFLGKIEACTALYRDGEDLASDETQKDHPQWRITADGSKEIAGIMVYPNPSSDYVNISGQNAIRTLSVVTMDGKTVFERTIDSQEFQLDVRDFSKGVYIISVTSDGGGTTTQKLIVK